MSLDHLQAIPGGIPHISSSETLAITATRYLAVASLTIVLHDAIENFSEECNLIWSGRKGFERTIFLIHRLVVPLGLVCAVIMTCGAALNTMSCKFLLGIMVLFAFVSIGLADGLVTMEVWQLWGCERRVLRHMQVAFAITYSGSAAFIIYSYVFVLNHFTFLPYEINICKLGASPRLITGTWACGLIFELAVFFSTLWNVLSTPRSGNAKITAMLYRDGSLYFVGVMALRLTNTVTAIVSKPESFFTLLFPTWALVTILVNRLVVNQSRERQHLRANVQMVNDLGAPRAVPPVMITRSVTQDYEMGRVRVDTASETYSDADHASLKSSLAVRPYDGILDSALV